MKLWPAVDYVFYANALDGGLVSRLPGFNPGLLDYDFQPFLA